MKEIAIGIDQSLTSTGIAVVECKTLDLIEYGRITSEHKGILRLNEIAEDILETIKEYKKSFKINVVGVEGYAYNKKFGGGKVFDLAELGGVIKREIYNTGLHLEVITVQEHVIDLTGKKPTSDKLPRIQKVNEVYGIELRAGKSSYTQESDAADAISIARYLAKRY